MQPYQLHRRKHHSYNNLYSTTFDGTNEYLYRAEANYRSGDSQGAISFWIKTSFNSGALSSVVFNSADEASATRYLAVFVLNGQVGITQRNNDTNTQIDSTTVISDGTWKHVVINSDGSAYTIYINNSLESLTVTAGSNNGDWFADTSNRDNIAIGAFRRSTTSGYQNGLLDEVAVWSAPLDSSQRTELYNSGKPANLLSHSAASNLVSYWRMGDNDDDLTATTGIVHDIVGGFHLTPQNTESGDKSTDVP